MGGAAARTSFNNSSTSIPLLESRRPDENERPNKPNKKGEFPRCASEASEGENGELVSSLSTHDDRRSTPPHLNDCGDIQLLLERVWKGWKG
jgi:hypothetical protein